MNSKHLSEEQLVMHFYGDSDAPAAVEEHLRQCGECRAALERLKAVLGMVEASPALLPPERGPDFAARVWERLEPQLEKSRGGAFRRFWSGWMAPPRWVVAGALAALLLATFLVGRWSRDREMTNGTIPAAQVRERILLVAVGEHLERSHMVLVELSNLKPGGEVDLSREQNKARELVETNRLYRQTAAVAGEAGLAAVLEQLERVLVEVANSPSRMSPKELSAIQQKLEARGILFKLRVISNQVEERARPAPPPAEAARKRA